MNSSPDVDRHDDSAEESEARYASWPRRVAATVVDLLPIGALAFLAVALVWLTRNQICDGDPAVRDLGQQCGNSGATTLGFVCFLVCWLAMIGYGIWNFGFRQGVTGASLGKSLLKIRVVDAATQTPVGFWRSLIRQLVHALDVVTVGVGFLWPLWDRRHQTFADKLTSTVCIGETR